MAKRIELKKLSIFYGDFKAVEDVDMMIEPRSVTAFIGPSGCGKSTVLRSLDRMLDVTPGAKVEGEVLLDGVDLYGKHIDPVRVRHQVGMVFQQPNPFPTMTIRGNVLAGLALNKRRLSKSEADEVVETSLRGSNLWEEVKDRLDRPGSSLSGGQQQRLCIARTLAMKPDVVLYDEPCSALDPISTYTIEETIRSLCDTGLCQIIVTHNMEQAGRVSDRTAFFYVGDMVETGTTQQIFSAPKDQRLADYLTGRFG